MAAGQEEAGGAGPGVARGHRLALSVASNVRPARPSPSPRLWCTASRRGRPDRAAARQPGVAARARRAAAPRPARSRYDGVASPVSTPGAVRGKSARYHPGRGRTRRPVEEVDFLPPRAQNRRVRREPAVAVRGRPQRWAPRSREVGRRTAGRGQPVVQPEQAGRRGSACKRPGPLSAMRRLHAAWISDGRPRITAATYDPAAAARSRSAVRRSAVPAGPAARSRRARAAFSQLALRAPSWRLAWPPPAAGCRRQPAHPARRLARRRARRLLVVALLIAAGRRIPGSAALAWLAAFVAGEVWPRSPTPRPGRAAPASSSSTSSRSPTCSPWCSSVQDRVTARFAARRVRPRRRREGAVGVGTLLVRNALACRAGRSATRATSTRTSARAGLHDPSPTSSRACCSPVRDRAVAVRPRGPRWRGGPSAVHRRRPDRRGSWRALTRIVWIARLALVRPLGVAGPPRGGKVGIVAAAPR